MSRSPVPTAFRALLGAGILSLVLLLAAGCGGGDVAPPASSTADGADLDALRALPYVDFSSDPADGTKRGVVLYDEQRSCPGYNLYSNHSLCSAELIDARGSEAITVTEICRAFSNSCSMILSSMTRKLS